MGIWGKEVGMEWICFQLERSTKEKHEHGWIEDNLCVNIVLSRS